MMNKYCSDELKDLYSALAKAQMEITVAEKNCDNNFLKSKYADLVSIMNASREPLAKNGLCVIQQVISEEGDNFLMCRLGHESGQWIESKIKIDVKYDPSDKNTKINYMHALGSAITYLRKYTYSALVGVGTGTREDDDGNDAMPKSYVPEKKEEVKPVYLNDEEIHEITLHATGQTELLMSLLKKLGVEELKFVQRKHFKSLRDHLQRESEKLIDAERQNV